jgi:hypothetical protein
MPLPVRVPCSTCCEDTLHVWDPTAKGWMCNGCKSVRHPIAQPTTLDVVAFRESNRRMISQHKRNKASKTRQKTRGAIPWSIKPQEVNNVTHGRIDSDQRETESRGGSVSVGSDGTNTSEPGKVGCDDERSSKQLQHAMAGSVDDRSIEKRNGPQTPADVEEDLNGHTASDQRGVRPRAKDQLDVEKLE